ncbi:uncharacterized protein A1O9_01424 [Exophiala aquamarina CBS 119918]|uniref:Major facilitator superfamily (MFS) profile domain-containing protein n=1 Tax=Exophiala aquamarina CBS 119918 TaxID=1182545 RepID=A0A072PUB3_9EURO|nr:uncharacterized protein A1O9_01424 [Exophiala aquamarina CBS 119918]KEF63446.1 hypothetical protein A1O9_01424 [Exophiala aquamarina CBS 119918]
MATTLKVNDDNDASQKENNVELIEGVPAFGQHGLKLTAEERQRERRVKWKIDLLILPLLSTVYFLASMGRSDLGNAKIAGMSKELHLTPKQYSNVASIFYVGYITLQLPGTLLVRKIGPPLQFGIAMMGWGLITACTVVIHSYAELMVIRSFVGVTEAFVQGSVFYLSFWYPYNELATRGSIFFSMATVAGAFNGLIAYGVQKNLNGQNGWLPWRWIFLIEGIIPVGWAFVILLLLPHTPEKIRFGFTEEDKKLIIRRSRRAQNTGESKILPRKILQVLFDYKFWMLVGIESATVSCVSAVGNFLPEILHNFGWTVVKSQLMSVIVYACAFVSILFWARVSDKWGRRGYVILINCAQSIVGLILLLAVTNNSARFFATCLLAMGLFPNVVINLTWSASINVGYTHRASATALINCVAQAVALGVNQAYDDPPLYRKGNGTALGLLSLAALLAGSLRLALRWENKKKLENQYTEQAAQMRLRSIDEIGNTHPDHFFMD